MRSRAADKTIGFRIEASSYPNLTGGEQNDWSMRYFALAPHYRLHHGRPSF
jgi:hypothetical protein